MFFIIFSLQGGDGQQHVELNHPIYITNNREGGYGNKGEYERGQEMIYAGIETAEYGMVRITKN